MKTKEKEALRASLLAWRASLSEQEKRGISDSVCRLLLSELERLCPDLVLLYAAVRGEIDLSPLAHCLLSRGVGLAFPRSKRGGVMCFHTVSEMSELDVGLYGIPEPPRTAPKAVFSSRSVCIVPALAYDGKGYRLGYGGGYYDRFLSAFPGKVLGVAPSPALFEDLPHEAHDQRASAIVTERGICRISVS